MKRLAMLIVAGCACAAQGATFRVDDTTTLPSEAITTMQWRSLAPTRNASHDVEGTSVITVRLNTAPWLNRVGRIYLALPQQPVGDVTAEWTTQGKLLPGQVRSGNRTLVFAGPIRASLIEDTILLRVATDGRRLGSPQRLEFHFEIDVD
ncbi:MAG TPA: hypothetical protein VFP44_02855 [Usitatibacter sp.]|nr:hypothetical protein [Usitatibacter sp.]